MSSNKGALRLTVCIAYGRFYVEGILSGKEEMRWQGGEAGRSQRQKF